MKNMLVILDCVLGIQSSTYVIMLTGLYNFDPHYAPLLYRKTGVFINFIFFALNHRLWVLVRTALMMMFLTSIHNLFVELKLEKNIIFPSEKLYI